MAENSAHPNRKYSRYYTYIEPIISDPIISGYFTLVATLVLTAFFIFFALSPTFSTIVGLVRKIDDQKKLITSMDSKISNLIIAQENYNEIEPFLPLLNSAFPQKSSPETIITAIVQSASSSAVTINAMQIGSAYLTSKVPPTTTLQPALTQSKSSSIAALGIPTTDFSVGVQGTKDSIRQFGSILQSQPRIISLATFSLGTDESVDKAGPDKLSAVITGSAYYLVDSNIKK